MARDTTLGTDTLVAAAGSGAGALPATIAQAPSIRHEASHERELGVREDDAVSASHGWNRGARST